jgi:RNA polymerase sigma-70 factor (ECF subfamily)
MNDAESGKDRKRRYASLCEPLRPELLRFAFWLARDRALAEDIVQEAMLRAWKSLDALDDDAKARPWMLTIVRREHARTFERKRLEVADVDALVQAEAEVLASDEDAGLAEMREALFRLEAEYREPLVMQVMMGFSTHEIAAELGLTQGAVLTRLYRARQQLRRALGGGEEREPEDGA